MKSRLWFTQSTCWFILHVPFLSSSLSLDFVAHFSCRSVLIAQIGAIKCVLRLVFSNTFFQTISSLKSYEGNKPRSSCNSNQQRTQSHASVALRHCDNTPTCGNEQTLIYLLNEMIHFLFMHSEDDIIVFRRIFVINQDIFTFIVHWTCNIRLRFTASILIGLKMSLRWLHLNIRIWIVAYFSVHWILRKILFVVMRPKSVHSLTLCDIQTYHLILI